MKMEKVGVDTDKYLKKLKQRGVENKGNEHRSLYMQVSYSAARDLHIKRLGIVEFGVFIILRTRMNKDGVAYPSLGTIAYEAGLSVGTVQRVVNRLVDKEWIRKEGRVANQNGQFGNTKYRILERDLIRGLGDESFINKPVAKFDNGD